MKHLLCAAWNSLKGLGSCIREEKAFRVEITFFILFLAFSCFFTFSKRAYLEITCGFFLIFITELLNSGLEKLGDRITKKNDPLIAYAKDVGSAAVFLAVILTIYITVHHSIEKIC